jgi:hypothetical protein
MLSNEYLKTARTLLRVAQNMTDQTIADRLKVLSEDYERRAEKVSQGVSAEALALWDAGGEREGSTPK